MCNRGLPRSEMDRGDEASPGKRDRSADGRLSKGQSDKPGGRPKMFTEVKQAARRQTEAAIETFAAVINDESAPTAARLTAARAILRHQDTPWTDALRAAVRRAGEDGRVLLARIAEKRERGKAPNRLPKP
jgi:hypothetical protein